MVKKRFADIRRRIEEYLQVTLGRISPNGRIVIILAMLILFGAGSIFITVSSIYEMGNKNANKQMQIEHIERLELENRQKPDSINPLNNFNYE